MYYSSRRAILLLIIALVSLTSCTRQRPRVEVQFGPSHAGHLVFHPLLPFRLMVVERHSTNGGPVSIWDVENAEAPLRLLTLTSPALDACFAPDGESIYTTTADGRIRRWSMTGDEIWSIQAVHSGSVTVATTSQVSTFMLVSGATDGAISFWDAKGKPIDKPLQAYEGAIKLLAVDRSGTYVASVGGKQAGLIIWKKAEGSWLKLQDFHTQVTDISAISFSPQDDLLVIASNKGLDLWRRKGDSFEVQKQLSSREAVRV